MKAAEEFVARDPFAREGLVGRIAARKWNEVLVP